MIRLGDSQVIREVIRNLWVIRLGDSYNLKAFYFYFRWLDEKVIRKYRLCLFLVCSHVGWPSFPWDYLRLYQVYLVFAFRLLWSVFKFLNVLYCNKTYL